MIKNIDKEKSIIDIIEKYANNVNIKSRNFSPNGIDIIAEIRTKDENTLMKDIINHDSITHASLVAHDGVKEF